MYRGPEDETVYEHNEFLGRHTIRNRGNPREEYIVRGDRIINERTGEIIGQIQGSRVFIRGRSTDLRVRRNTRTDEVSISGTISIADLLGRNF
jgi:hypothetical protein